MNNFLRFWFRLGLVAGTCWTVVVLLLSWDALVVPARPSADARSYLESLRLMQAADVPLAQLAVFYDDARPDFHGPALSADQLSAHLADPMARRPRDWSELPAVLLLWIAPLILYGAVGWALAALFD